MKMQNKPQNGLRLDQDYAHFGPQLLIQKTTSTGDSIFISYWNSCL